MNRPEAFVALGLVLIGGGLAALALPELLALGVVIAGAMVTAYGISRLRAGEDIWHSNEPIGVGDGVTSRFRTPTPFVAGTLSVFVNGLSQTPVGTAPANGEFEFDWTPIPGDEITATWKEA